MRILISGAGVAGLTLAYWLEKHGHEPIIVEKSADIRTEGYMIDFTGTGWDVAERMGLIPVIRERANPAENVIYKNGQDKVTAQVSVQKLLEAGGGNNFVALNRRDLVLTLYESVRDKVEICFGKSIEGLTQSIDHVEVTFSDGSSDRFDLHIGCDGIHSNTRKLVFGPASDFVHHLGYQFAIFQISPLQYDLARSYQMHVIPNLQVAVYPTTPDKWLVFVLFKHDSPAVPFQKDRISLLKERLEGLEWYVPEILDKINDGDYVFQDTLTQVQMAQWHKGRVGIIGDAAYCPTLISGQGASMAMAGAYFLAQAFEQCESHEDAFQMMDAQLRPHIDKIQASARSFASTFVPKSYMRMALINVVLRLSNASIFRSLVGKQITVNSILPAK